MADQEENKFPLEEPEGDFSAFDNGIDDSLFDPLREDNKSDSKSELEIVRDVLRKLGEEYGIEFEVYDGRELGYELALNHRLDDMSYSSPRSIPDEIALAIQANKVTDEQASDLFDRLTDQEELDFKDGAELQRHLFNIYSVIEVIAVDPQRVFDNDLEAQSTILGSLHASAENVQEYITSKPERDREPLSAREFLTDRLDMSMSNIRRNFANWHPELIEPLAEVRALIQTEVDKIPDDLKEPRGHLINILKAQRKISGITLGDEIRVVTDEQKLHDVLTLISDL